MVHQILRPGDTAVTMCVGVVMECVMLPFNGRVSLRLINRNPEELIFTTSFQETFSAYSPDSHSPHVELVKSVHPSQVTLLSDYSKQCVGKNISI